MLRITLIQLLMAIPLLLMAQLSRQDWTIYESDHKLHLKEKSDIEVVDYQLAKLSPVALVHLLEQSPSNEKSTIYIELPMPDGSLSGYDISLSRVLPPSLAKKYPTIRSYRGVGRINKQEEIYLDLSPRGLKAMIIGSESTIIIDPYVQHRSDLYISYDKKMAVVDKSQWTCDGSSHLDYTQRLHHPDIAHTDGKLKSTGQVLMEYKIAVATTAEYTALFGGTVTDGLAAVVTAINRVSGIYEREMGIAFVLVPDNDQLIYTDAASDPFANTSVDVLSIQDVLDDVIGNENYDLGHMFTTSFGGIAALGGLCSVEEKGKGLSGLPNPVGDPFYVDYVAHEIGHQLGGTHTFNGNSQACIFNRIAHSAFEPGSGSTIMAYAGICGSNNLQYNSDAYFHPISLLQMTSFVESAADTCANHITTSNNSPTADANPDDLSNLVIPIGTPFELEGEGIDPDGDPLSYLWEQWDLGPQQDVNQGDNGIGPLFRSWAPTTKETRVFPRLENLLDNTMSVGETLPSTQRDLSFKLTVKDNHGGWSADQVNIEVTPSAGPFRVTNHNSTSSTITENIQVTWDVAGTNGSIINCSHIDVYLLLTETGEEILIEDNTPNDGSTTAILPYIQASGVRVKVKCDNNIFFDINDTDLTIDGGVAPCNVSGEINDNPILDDMYSSETVLVNSGKVPTGGNVMFTAGEAIEFKSSAEVEVNGNLEVYIQPCDPQ